METLFIYLLRSSGLIAVFYLAYHFLVRKETFFTSNRWFLMTGLFTSLLLPLLTITKIIYIERPKVVFQEINTASNYNAIIQEVPSIESFDWIQLLWVTYIIITVLLIIKIIFNLISLYRMLYQQQKIKNEQFTLVDLNHDIAPFSFFNYIVFNSNLYSNEELQSILLHEKIHSKEMHSFDVMIAKLFCIIFWFNPFVWLYKKAIIQNLEYIADQKAVAQLHDRKVYQKALLKVVSNQNCLSITNNFYQSLIKKRIVMLNKNQSHQRNSWKYSLIIPVLVSFVFLFQVQVEAQTVEIKKDNGEVIIAEKIKGGLPIEGTYVFDKISSDTELKNDVVAINAKYDINFKIYNIKRNAKGEIIAIKMSYNDKKGNKGKTEQARDIPIRPIFFKISTDDNGKISIGFFDNSDMVIKPKDAVNESKITTIESIEDNAIIFVDGERYSKEDLNYLDSKGLESISVVTDKASMQKYGVTNKDKIIVIETNWSTKSKVPNSKETNLIFSNPFSELALKETITDFNDVSNINFNEPLMILDGKEISKKELEKINACDISNVNVLNSSSSNIVEKYGDKAKNGVIEIQTVAYYEKNNPTLKKNETKKVNVKVSDNNNGFIITKINNTNELLFYQNSLAKNKINFSFDKVKRDKSGLITAIFITLEDSEDKISKAFKNKKGIEDIFIGKEKGALFIK